MNWTDITVEQYQGLHSIMTDKAADEWDKEIACIAYLTGKNIDSIIDMPYSEYKELRKGFAFLSEDKIEGQAKKVIKANGKTYRVQFNLTELPVARYVEVKHFAQEDYVKNLHLMMASIVVPDGLPYSHKHHSLYAEDMKKASIVDVHNTGVFFCKLYARLIPNIKGYMAQMMTETGLTPIQAASHVEGLCNAMAGFTI